MGPEDVSGTEKLFTWDDVIRMAQSAKEKKLNVIATLESMVQRQRAIIDASCREQKIEQSYDINMDMKELHAFLKNATLRGKEAIPDILKRVHAFNEKYKLSRSPTCLSMQRAVVIKNFIAHDGSWKISHESNHAIEVEILV